MLTMAYQRMMQEPAKKRYQAREVDAWLHACRQLLTTLTALAQQRVLRPALGKTAAFQQTAHTLNATLMGMRFDEPPTQYADPACSTLNRIALAAWSMMQIARPLTLPGMKQDAAHEKRCA
jgi:hypothetical protein